MAFQATETKTVIAYNNKVEAANITNVTLAVTAVADSSYPVVNLKYADPWRMFKVTATPTGQPVIYIEFTAAQTFTCFGVVNHNIKSLGYGLDLYSSADNVSYGLVGTISNAALLSDGNILFRFPTSSNHKWWRITLTKASAWLPFWIGAVFFGTHAALASNPIEGGTNQRLGVPIDFIESAGNAKHVRFGATKYTTDAEMTFERMSQTAVHNIVETIGRPNQKKVIAIIPPGQVSFISPLGFEHIFAYLLDATGAPREGVSAGTHKYDLVLTLKGVM